MSSRRGNFPKSQRDGNDRSISSIFKKPSFSSLTKSSATRTQTSPLPPYILVTPPPRYPVHSPQPPIDVPIMSPPPTLDGQYPLPPPTTGYSYDPTLLDNGHRRQSRAHNTHSAGPVSPRGPGFFTGPPPPRPRESTDMSGFIFPLEPPRRPKRS
ncbi:hypothetical protein PQX77_008880 [Marasmius sp. AFHP31]|nr:hypothetical protein PQX77_008880 [Marasmius sp. AFHP31]